jgi:hypothetical protein
MPQKVDLLPTVESDVPGFILTVEEKEGDIKQFLREEDKRFLFENTYYEVTIKSTNDNSQCPADLAIWTVRFIKLVPKEKWGGIATRGADLSHIVACRGEGVFKEFKFMRKQDAEEDPRLILTANLRLPSGEEIDEGTTGIGTDVTKEIVNQLHHLQHLQHSEAFARQKRLKKLAHKHRAKINL